MEEKGNGEEYLKGRGSGRRCSIIVKGKARGETAGVVGDEVLKGE